MTDLGLTEEMLSAPREGPRRILTIEGGGVRGAFSLRILHRMEQELRTHYKKPDLVLADHFHLIAGTSVGAILATFLSWGWSVDAMEKLFNESLQRIFSRAQWWKLPLSAFRRGPLREILQKELADISKETGLPEPALFGTRKLKTWLLIVVRNLSTGSAWPLLNHPDAKYNKLFLPDGTPNDESNLLIPLWQLVRASTAAPWYFPPEWVRISPEVEVEFIDGGVTAYNNPSVIAYLMATLPCFPLKWEKGRDKLHVVSVGTGSVRARLGVKDRWRLGRVGVAGKVPGSLIESVSLEQDLIMRSMGECLFGMDIDGEIGSLTAQGGVGDAFRYVRYNRLFSPEEVQQACEECDTRFSLSAVQLAPWLRKQGDEYAAKSVTAAHLV